MLATAFQGKKTEKDTVIIAAGVSNSQEVKQQEFLREECLLLDILKKYNNKTIIYFSTCSVYQIESSPYIKHKLKMENLIQSLASSFYIFRLPQVVGLTTNTTIVSYFVQCLLQKKSLIIQQKASRSLIDVSDVVRIALLVIENGALENSLIDVTNTRSIFVPELLNKISRITGISPIIELVDGGYTYKIPVDKIKLILPENDFIFSDQYYDLILESYVPKIIHSMKK